MRVGGKTLYRVGCSKTYPHKGTTVSSLWRIYVLRSQFQVPPLAVTCWAWWWGSVPPVSHWHQIKKPAIV
jgi:hypothetical protein